MILDDSFKELTSAELTVNIKPDDIKIYEKINGQMEIIGQPRAIKALRMGMQIKNKGYNIFVTGFPGTGKRTAIHRVLKEIKPEPKSMMDLVYVYNYANPDSPRLLSLPAGGASLFKRKIHDTVENLKASIKTRLKSKAFQRKRNNHIKEMQKRESLILSSFEEKLLSNNFQIIQMGEGKQQVVDIMPVFKDKPLDFDELHLLVESGELTEQEWDAYMEKYYQYMDDMKEIVKRIKVLREDAEQKIGDFRRDFITPLIQAEIDLIRHSYADKKVNAYLNELENDINNHLYLFTEELEPEGKSGGRALSRYGVNILVEQTNRKMIPVVYENNPTLYNLFGTIDSIVDANGNVNTSFMRIKAGSLIKASGGFLILQAEDVLKYENIWQKLKSSLMTGEVEIPPAENLLVPQNLLIKPEAVKIVTKIIIIGDPNLYEVLYSYDPDFQKLFKVPAEFDSDIESNDINLGHYIRFIKSAVKAKKLRPITSDGISAVIEYGIKLAGHKQRLSTRFSQIADLLCEADYWALEQKKKSIDRPSVRQALQMKNYFYNLPAEKLEKLIYDGDILITTGGSAVGRINGLTVYDRGFYSFGRPVLITAQVSPGKGGILNIEREAGLSGEFHDKGVFILEGFLRNRYAANFPLSVHASICFEQSYSNVDGDSASSTEIYALISALAEVPLRQDLSVTGSVNQMGEIQPIGGATEKIECFFRICQQRGLSGTQGVILPAQNIANLILDEEVVAAVSRGEFHIYTVKNIDQALELLTGMEAGKRQSDGSFPPHSINYKVHSRLKEMAELVKKYSAS